MPALTSDDLEIEAFTTGNGHCNFTGPQLVTALTALDGWAATATLLLARLEATRPALVGGDAALSAILAGPFGGRALEVTDPRGATAVAATELARQPGFAEAFHMRWFWQSNPPDDVFVPQSTPKPSGREPDADVRIDEATAERRAERHR